MLKIGLTNWHGTYGSFTLSVSRIMGITEESGRAILSLNDGEKVSVYEPADIVNKLINDVEKAAGSESCSILRTKDFYVYCIPPIDVFDACMLYDDYIEQKLAELTKALSVEKIEEDIKRGKPIDIFMFEYVVESLEKHIKALATARDAIKIHPGWKQNEKDGIRGIYFFAVPAEIETQLGIIIKQSNNGTTFIASPVPLPHINYLTE